MLKNKPINFIPRFIAEKHQEGKKDGNFTGTALLVDIRGFTALTESLMAQGKQGLESLSGVMNRLFTPVVDTIHAWGGFIASFSGDALSALFPAPVSPVRACNAAWHIAEVLRRAGNHNTRAGRFTLSVKIGVAAGNVYWAIVPYGPKAVFFFAGDALQHSQEAQKLAKEHIVVNHAMVPMLDTNKVAWLNANQAYAAVQPCAQLPPPRNTEAADIALDTVRDFIDEAVLGVPASGEFRRITSLFVRFPEPASLARLKDLIRLAAQEVKHLAGSLFPIDYQGRQIVLPIVFGAPVGHEDDVLGAVRCVQALRRSIPVPLHAGITFGPVFAGFVGSDARRQYTCIGDTMNVAARLMELAPEHTTWLDQSAARMVDPKRRTVFLMNKTIKGKDQALAVYGFAAVASTRIGSPFRGPITGRERELHILTQAIAAFQTSRPAAGAVIISGTAGVGKSRLVYHVMDTCNQEMQPILLQADRFSTDSYYVFIHLLQDYFQLAEATDAAGKQAAFQRKFDRLFPTGSDNNAGRQAHLRMVLGWLLELIDPDALSGMPVKGRRQVIVQALVTFFNALRNGKVLLLVVDDLQWLDEQSRYVLQQMTRAKLPFIVLATVRTDEKGEAPELGQDRDFPLQTIRLKEWSKDSLSLFTAHALGGPCSLRLLDHIQNRTQGIPLYVEQYINYLKENNLLQATGKGWDITKAGETELPAGLSNLLVSRIDHLPMELKECMQFASVLGQQFDTSLLLQFLNDADRCLKESRLINQHIPTAVRRGVREGIWLGAAGRLRFSHDLMREAAYSMQSLRRLRTLHRLAGDCLEKQRPKPAFYADMAYHFSRAEAHEKALIYAKKGAEYAEANSAFTRAIRLWQQALELSEKLQGIGHIEYAHILYSLGRGYTQISRFEAAKNLLLKALSIYKNKHKQAAENLVETCVQLAIVYGIQGHHGKASAYNREGSLWCRRHLGENHPHMAYCYVNSAFLCQLKGNYQEACDFAKKALDIRLTHHGVEHPETANSYMSLGIMHLHLQMWPKAEEYLQKALEIRQNLFGPSRLETAQPLHHLAEIARGQGNLEKAALLHQKSHRIFLRFMGEKSINTATSYYGLGDLFIAMAQPTKALAHYRRAQRIFEDILPPGHHEIATLYISMGDAHAQLGEGEQADAYYTRALTALNTVLEPHHPNLIHTYLQACRMQIKLNRFKQALAYLIHVAKDEARLASQAPDIQGTYQYLMGQILRGLGDSRAPHHFQTAINLYQQCGLSAKVREVEAAMNDLTED